MAPKPTSIFIAAPVNWTGVLLVGAGVALLVLVGDVVVSFAVVTGELDAGKVSIAVETELVATTTVPGGVDAGKVSTGVEAELVRTLTIPGAVDTGEVSPGVGAQLMGIITVPGDVTTYVDELNVIVVGCEQLIVV